MAWQEIDPIGSAMSATDVEVANSAWEDQPNYYEPDNDGNHDLEKVESIHGGPIEPEDTWADAHGVMVHQEDDEEIDGALAERDAELKAARQEIEELKERADPYRREREAQERERLTYEVLQNPAAVVDGVRGMQQQMQNLNVEASLAKAHVEHGQDFDMAFQTLTSLDPRNPGHRSTVQAIYQSPNPGQALMQWHSQLRGSSGGNRPRLPASLNTNSPGGSRSMPAGRTSGMSDRAHEGVWADFSMGDERDISESAWR